MNTTTKTVSYDTFASDVLEANGPVLVDFWAEWCAPCRMVSPVLDEIGRENAGKLTVTKLNVDDYPDIAADYHVTSIPTMAVFSGGELVKTIVGARPKAALLRDLAGFLD
ncbi:thioredoxin [Mycolicibacterium stellerae]|uniref:thioredoxin n=1 Tax=Mycolicibacterium stellerae TaxID=2358193 RepID=UPI000F0B622A|nr:thioredoxin [Mycolicibacterium stellerae]